MSATPRTPDHRRGSRAPRRVTALTLAVTLAFAAGCGPRASATSAGASTPPTATGSPEVTSPTAGAPAASPSSSGSPAAASQRCRVAGLRITTGAEDSGSGHRAVALVFRNAGPTACWLRGYPGVDGIDRSGQTRAHAARTLSGYLGGTRRPVDTVLLAPGGSASALVEALGFDPAGSSRCEPYAVLRVTPPDETRSVRLPWHTDSCSSLEVHPVVAGVSGSAT